MSHNGKEIKTLTALEIPVEIFILFLVKNKKDFSVQDVITEFNALHKVELTHSRVKQILEEFTRSGKLTSNKLPSGTKNKTTTYYSFNKLW